MGKSFKDLETTPSGFSNFAITPANGDDHPGNKATGSILPIGGGAAGFLNFVGDEDWFSVSLTAGVTYRFQLSISDNDTRGLRTQIFRAGDDDVTESDNGMLEYTPTTSGQHFVSVLGDGKDVASSTPYRITAEVISEGTASENSIRPFADDYGSSTSTTGVVQVNGSTTGNIETVGDSDWFRVTLTAGHTYSIDLTQNSALGGLADPYVILRDANGVSLRTDDDSGAGFEAQISYTAATSGTYYIEAKASPLTFVTSLITGAYRLSVTDPNATPPPTPQDDYAASISTTGSVQVGGAVTGNLETGTDSDWFRVTLTAGQTYRIDMTRPGSASVSVDDPYLVLRNSVGVSIATDDDSGAGFEARITFTATTSGTYYIEAKASPLVSGTNDTGTYTVAVAEVTPTTPPTPPAIQDDYAATDATTGSVQVGDSATGRIEVVNDNDWFRVTLTAGRTYRIDMEGSDTSGGTLNDPYLTLRDSAGFSLRTDDDTGTVLNARITFTATATGFYYIDAKASPISFGNSTGTYRVSVTDTTVNAPSTPPTTNDDYLDSTATTGRLTVGGSVTGAINSNDDDDWFAIDLQGGLTYRFTLTDLSNSDLDPFISVYLPTGVRVTYTTGELQFSPTTSGRYFVGASDEWLSNISGTNYRISALQISDDFGGSTTTAGVLSSATPVSGTIDFNGDADWFAVNLQVGQTYRFSLTSTGGGSSSFDPTLTIYSATGTSLLEAGSSLGFTPTTSGTYYIAAADTWFSSDLTGKTYRLALTQTADDYAANIATSGRLTASTPATGTINFDGDEDWFQVDLAADATWRFSIAENGTNQGYTPWLYLYNASGTRVASSLTGSVDFVTTTAGTYYVAAADWSSRDLSNLRYTINVTRGPSPAETDALTWKIANQWHLSDTGSGTGGLRTDINVMSAWGEYTGRGVVIGIVDEGIDTKHPNLSPNYDVLIDFDAIDNDSDATATKSDENHATAVSGSATAVSTLSNQGSGVAPHSTIAGFRLDFDRFSIPILKLNLDAQQNVDVSNNSWGYVSLFSDNFLSPSAASLGQSLIDGVSKGRDGLGTVFVFAAGNSRASGDNVNNHNFQNSRFTIAVGATTKSGAIASFSTPGAAILVSAPGDDILTTDRSGAGLGYQPNSNYATVDGTSFASPIVSGVVALMLEAHPHLGYRDVQSILALSARHEPLTQTGWVTNGAANWNGGGMRASHDYGFGLVDAHAAVRLAETWSATSTYANEVKLEGTATPNQAIPDNNQTGITSTIFMGGSLDVENVEIHIVIDHDFIGDLIIRLTSPSGMQSVLLNRPGRSASSTFGTSQDDINFVFSSTFYRGESSQGAWTLQVVDAQGEDTGALVSWTLRLYGTTASENDTYYYTDEFMAIADRDMARKTLSDTGGTDILNLAAVTGAVTVNLAAGASSVIAGQTLTLGSNTLIEHVVLGDGADTAIGNAADNALYGGRGNDHLEAGAGNDALNGGAGADEMIGGSGSDLYVADNVLDQVVEEANQGVDTVFVLVNDYVLPANVEHAQIQSDLGFKLTGNTDANVLTGGGGGDIILGMDGNDMIFGGAGNDTLNGGAGNDTLQGDSGNDTYVLGAGLDRVVLTNTPTQAEVDTITDFQAGAGGDVLDMHNLFTTIGYAGTNPIADGYLRFLQQASDTHFQMDWTGGGDSYTTVVVLKDTIATAITNANFQI